MSIAGNRRLAARKAALTPERAEKIAQALVLRREGKTYQQIADEMGTSRSQAWEWVKRGLKEMLREPSDNLRALELDRLDALWRAAWRQLQSNFWVVSHGKVVRDEDTNEPIIDEAAKMAALDRCLKIQERRAKLLGLDAPTRSQTITMDAVDAEIQRLQQELARNDPAVT